MSDLKQHILTAALNAAEGGLDRVTPTVVAQAAGVSRPTVYKYFKKGRTALLEAVRSEARRVENAKVVALFTLTGQG